ncbi:MAG: putative Mannan endo-1,4-beta-mannosidase [Promethearchaeota archaeon]|nr:MAG: putative Mannan endo-1,4-beta-mannosidase [Candidatus Lokiarchaeota archaeon]
MAVYLWAEYDPEVIKREIEIISNLGANCIRIFIRWEDLNPEMGRINDVFFEKFDNFLSHAKDFDIYLVPTLLIGHMSGQDWFPEWFYLSEEQKEENGIEYQKIDKPPYKKEKCYVRDIYTDPAVLENSKLQIQALLTRYKDEQIIISWDLSNENQFWMSPKSTEIGTHYMKEMYNLMKSIDPNHLITYGMGKPDESSGFISFGSKGFAQYNDYYCVHVYPEWLYPMTPDILDFYISYRIAYECCLAKVSGIPVQLQEFGLSDDFFPLKEQHQRDQLIYGYFNVALWDVLLNEIRGGVLLWDFCDFLPELEHRNPYDHKQFELHFGAVDHNYKLKASGKAFEHFSKFLEKTDFLTYSRSKSEIAIVLSDNFNQFPEVENKRSILEDNSDNHSKSLFSSFLFTKMCHFTPDFISLHDTEVDFLKYRILLIPNVHYLSSRTINKCKEFLETGNNKILYISSNTYIPEQLFGPIEWNFEELRKKQVKLKLYDENLKENFPSTITFKYIRSQLTINKLESSEILPLYIDEENEIMMFYQQYGTNNKAIFVANSPEINHTMIKNCYKKETMHILYDALFEWTHLEREVNCDNPLLEVGMLYHKNKKNALLIVINHEATIQLCKISLKIPWKSIQEFYQKNFRTTGSKNISMSIDGYDNYIFSMKMDI